MSNTPVTAEDLYLYAMQLLDPEEQTRLENFLLQSPEARAELANVRGDLALLAMSAEQQAPSPLTRQRLLKQVAREKKSLTSERSAAAPAAQTAVHGIAALPGLAGEPIPAGSGLRNGLMPIQQDGDTYTPSSDGTLPFRSYVEDEAPRKNVFAVLTPWAGWAVAAGMAVGVWNLYHRVQVMQDQVSFSNAKASKATESSAKALAVMETLRSGASQRFTLTKTSTPPLPSARVTYLAENGSLLFQGNNLEQLPPYKTYELWLIPIGEGRQPIPAGTFKPDERGYASVILPELPKGVVAGTFGVTMEDDGGAQTPTLPILLIGS